MPRLAQARHVRHPWLLRTPLLSIALLFTSLHAGADTMVRSLDKVPGALKTPAARAAFDRGMSDKPLPDGFGTHLPEGITEAWLVGQLAPGEAGRVSLAGAKPWPARPGSYVAVVCLGAKSPTPAVECEGAGSGGPPDIRFGVIERGADGTLHMVARTDAPIDVPTDWTGSNIDVPVALDDDATKSAKGLPEMWQRFDLAPYQIRPDEYAFGVRAGWNEGYAGGFATFEALYLLRIDGKTLHVAFAQPMGFVKMLAGDWNKDGTRQHDASDGTNSLNLLTSYTDGYRDLQLREQRGKWHQTLRWSSDKQRYLPK